MLALCSELLEGKAGMYDFQMKRIIYKAVAFAGSKVALVAAINTHGW